MVLRNVWSLNVDEAIVVAKLKKILGKDYEILFPANSQLKNVDLFIIKLKNRKTKTIQVKSSRSYEHKGDYYSWNQIKKDAIFNPSNKVDFFIFVVHYPKFVGFERKMIQSYIIIPISDLKKIVKKKNTDSTDKYHFSFWVDEDNNRAIDYRNPKKIEIDFSKYLNNFKQLK